jgi:anti-anti-sigma factor
MEDGMASLGQVRVERIGTDVAVFELHGDHDMATAGELERLLNEALGEGRGIVIDLSDAQFIDSAVVHGLYKAQDGLERQGRRLVLQIKAASLVLGVLEITGLTTAAAIADDRRQAIAIASEQRVTG